MRQSTLFLKTQNDFPKDEEAINAKLLIRANFVNKLMSGVYSFLPLGFRVREKIINIIRNEMDALGAEILMPALHPKSIWDVTGRWDSLSKIMYQFKDNSGKDVGLGPTHEEIIAFIAKNIIFSYADMPLAVYQIQTKFRDEPRAKSGLLRGREFTMKDLYSFHASEESLNDFYEKAKISYQKIFLLCGLKSFITEASGGDFSKDYSHEFMVEASAGEDKIKLCRSCGFARNSEISQNDEKCLKCGSEFYESRCIEVGNIFKLGTRFSEPATLFFKDEIGEQKPVIMASYGIGIERLLGTIVEIYHDEKGILWPDSVAPFLVHLVSLSDSSQNLVKEADNLYEFLVSSGIEVLYDDRKSTPGEKFFDADLIGIPYRVVISEKTINLGKIEVKKRNENETNFILQKDLLNLLKSK